MPALILYETALGFALFHRVESDEVAKNLASLQKALNKYESFSRMVTFASFTPFPSPEDGLENINAISEGILTDFLRGFLETNVASVEKVKLGVADVKLASAIQDALGITCFTDESVNLILVGLRIHLHRFLKDVKQGDVTKAQLGLGHAYSRAKVKFNINKSDNMITQSINLIEVLDKDINTFAMRLREWYSWHFPELAKLVKDNIQFARIVKIMKDKSTASDDMEPAITDITGDQDVAKEIISAARASMGLELSEFDVLNIDAFANKVVSLADYRQGLGEYMSQKMHQVAPNLSVLLGENVGAKLIAHAGSVINLAKYPASTVQILGAEKALFRALKTRGKTPKYGLLFQSSFISKASKQNKGRISRYLANKCSMAIRLDAFQEFPTTKYGEELKQQVDQRLNFYESGKKKMKLEKNIDLMKKVGKVVQEEAKQADKQTSKKRKQKQEDEDTEEVAPKKTSKKQPKVEEEEEQPKPKKQKVETKSKKAVPKEENGDMEDEEEKPAKASKKPSKKQQEEEDGEEEEKPVAKTPSKSKTPKKASQENGDDEEEKPVTKTPSKPKTPAKKSKQENEEEEEKPVKTPSKKSAKKQQEEEEENGEEEEKSVVKTPAKAKTPAKKVAKDEDDEEEKPVAKTPSKPKTPAKKVTKDEDEEEEKPVAKTPSKPKTPAKTPVKAKTPSKKSQEDDMEDE